MKMLFAALMAAFLFVVPAAAQETCGNPLDAMTEKIVDNGGLMVALVEVNGVDFDHLVIFALYSNPADTGALVMGAVADGCIVSPPIPLGPAAPLGIVH